MDKHSPHALCHVGHSSTDTGQTATLAPEGSRLLLCRAYQTTCSHESHLSVISRCLISACCSRLMSGS